MTDTNRDRLETAQNVWLATVRPGGRPHLIPIWFVVDGGRWYICTAPESVKARNLVANPQVALALEDGSNPYIVEGEARAVEPAPTVVRLFKEKYDWDITTDTQYTQVFEVILKKRVMGSA
jgi:nitroimidazol reductase NimA-like FMN-containing flavoprotein (pyridoxamine 5'-phosphate oxidase superfamily)